MDIEDDDFFPEIYNHFIFSTKLVRVMENVIIPSNIKLKMEFIPMDDADSENIDRAFTKIRYWLDNVVNNAVLFSYENEAALDMFIDEEGRNPRVANMLMLTPDEPNDQLMAAIFQAKLQALAGTCLAFGPVEIQSDNQIGLSFTFVGDSSAVLPTMDDWIGERSYFDKPWWDRDDGSTLDVMPPEGADLSDKPTWAFSFDFLDKPKVALGSSGKIVRPEFRPTIIDGGKDTN